MLIPLSDQILGTFVAHSTSFGVLKAEILFAIQIPTFRLNVPILTVFIAILECWKLQIKNSFFINIVLEIILRNWKMYIVLLLKYQRNWQKMWLIIKKSSKQSFSVFKQKKCYEDTNHICENWIPYCYLSQKLRSSVFCTVKI